jgi:dihydroorotase
LTLPFGSLRKGAPADITVIDPDASYVIDASTFQSKSRNCPFDGMQVQGRTTMVLVAGGAAFIRNQLNV